MIQIEKREVEKYNRGDGEENDGKEEKEGLRQSEREEEKGTKGDMKKAELLEGREGRRGEEEESKMTHLVNLKR